jgi:hypothetical protein
MKYMNISLDINFNKKRMISIVAFICIISLITCPAVEITSKIQSRNLQYSLGSIYYELVYPINNLTGTGDRLKDVPYKVQCKIKKCDTGCCVGEIDSMTCGLKENCIIYLDESNMPTLLAGIIIPLVLLIIFIILFITFTKVYKLSTCKSICFSLACFTIILIPCVAYFVYKAGTKENSDSVAKEG